MFSFNALIVEDNFHAAEVLEKYLKEHNDIKIIGKINNAIDAVNFIKQQKPHVVFMDIHLEGNTTGIDVLKQCTSCFEYVIFTTAYTDYAIEGYDFNAISYIIKPYNKACINKAIEKMRNCTFNKLAKYDEAVEQNNHVNKTVNQHNDHSKKIFISVKSSYIPIKFDDISYIEAKASYSIIHLINQPSIVVSKPLGIFKENFESEEFVRIHKSYIININHIEQIKRGITSKVILKNNIELPISTTEKELFFRQIGIRR